MKTKLTLILSILGALLLSTPSVLSQSYSIVDLGASLGINSYAYGINNQQQVVGYWVSATNGIRAFLYSAGAMTDLGSLGGTNQYALNINRSGQVVGFADTASGTRAFLFSNGSITNLGPLGGLNSYAYGINDGGQIVGYVDTTNGCRAYIYGGNAVTNLGTLGGSNSFSFGVNASSLVVGASSMAGEVTNAFLWRGGFMTNLNDLLPTNSGWELTDARGINNSGEIVGSGFTGGQEQAFLFSGGQVTGLGFLDNATNSFAFGINNLSQVVGAGTLGNGTSQAFLWANGSLNNLNSLLPQGSGWDLREARGINDYGQIVGWGVISNQEHAFILSPNFAPIITGQPQSQTVAVGSNATFTVAVVGTPPLAYQWLKNGTAISGATSSSLAITNAQSANAAIYSVVISNSIGSVTSAEATLDLVSYAAFYETFETGSGNWTTVSGSSALTNSTAQNHTIGGTNSAHVGSSSNRMYHNLPETAGHVKATFWIYDAGQTRAYSEVRSYTGAGYGQGSLTQVLAIGKYNSVSMPGETWNSLYYQGRVLNGTNNGWFNLNAAGAPYRSSGWHKFEIERLDDGTTINFYVDGILSRTIAGATYDTWDSVTIGSVGSGSSTGDAWFDDIKIEHLDAPILVAQPQNQTVIAGNSATFSVSATGAPLTCQWRHNGINIPGATNTVLNILSAQDSDAGSYNAVLSNAYGPVISGTATLTVLDPPSIVVQPISQTNVHSTTVIFNVVATGAAPLFYQWQKNGTNITDGGTVGGAWSPYLTIANVTTNDAGTYSVVVTNVAGSATSQPAVLSVQGTVIFYDSFENGLGAWTNMPPTGTALVLSSGRVSAISGTMTACMTNSLNKMYHGLGAEVSGRAGATFWIYDDSGSQTRSFGEVRAYVGNVIQPEYLQQVLAIGNYRVPFDSHTGILTNEVTDPTRYQGRVLTGTNTGWFNLNGPWAPTRSTGWHKFQIVQAGDGSTIHFYIDDILSRTINNAAAATWDTVEIGSYGAGTGVPGNAWFDDVKVEYLTQVITAQPVSQTANQGNTVTFSVAATGAPLSYQWKKDGANIPGATLSSLTLSNVQSTDSANYSVWVSTATDTEPSALATLTVFAPPSITQQPASLTVNAGGTATFTVSACGLNPSYQWQKEGVSLADGNNIVGAMSSALTVSNAQDQDSGNYSAVVSNSVGTTISATATLTVIDPPVITMQPSAVTTSDGSWAVFSVTAGGGCLSFQWQKDGVAMGDGENIFGSGTPSLTLAGVEQALAGAYSVVVANPAGNTVSSNVALTIIDPPMLAQSPLSQTNLASSAVVLTAVVYGTDPMVYQWQANGTNTMDGGEIIGSTTESLTLTNITLADAGNYSVIVTNAAGSVSANATLLVLDPNADDDYDGRNNAQEFSDGTDPTDPNSVLQVQLGHWRFADTNWIGDQGQAPLFFTNLQCVPGWNGNALQIAGTNPASLTYRDVETNGLANINVRSGTIRFWFNPMWNSGSGPQVESRLIEVGSVINDWWAFLVSSNGSQVYLVTQTNGVSTTNVVGAINFTSNQWRQVTLTYGTDASAIYVDGTLAASGAGVSCYPCAAVRANGFSVGSDRQGNNSANGQFDELETFNYPMSASDIGNGYLAALVSVLSGNPTLDTDYDGRSDLQELYDRTDPYDPNSVAQVELGHWRFDDSNWLGAQGQAPLFFTNLQSVSGWEGNAMESINGSALIYRDVEANGSANINCRNGTLRFWFKPNWSSSTTNNGTGPQTEARFIEMGSQGDWWTLLINSNGTQIRFQTQTNGVGMTNLTAAVNWNSNDWHQVWLVYSPGNSALYVDGLPVETNGAGVAFYPRLDARANGFSVGCDMTGSNQVNGAIDELETFNYVLTPATTSTGPLPSGPPELPQTGTRLNRWAFDDTNWLSGFGYPPRDFTNLTCVPGCISNALSVDSTNLAFMQYNVFEADGHTNIALNEGTVAFWFQPNWDSASLGGNGPGTSGRLLEIGTWTTNNSYGCWSLYLDPSGTNIVFETQTNGAGAVLLQAGISWANGDWHHVALTYSASNSILYLDGDVAASGPGVAYWPGADVQMNDGLCIGSDNTGVLQARGQFDSMQTYDYPLDADAVAQSYAAGLSAINGDNETQVGMLNFQSFGALDSPAQGSALSNAATQDASSTGELKILQVNGDQMTVLLMGTKAGTNYCIASSTDMSPGSWQREAVVAGTDTSTQFTVSVGGRSNLFLLKVSGLPAIIAQPCGTDISLNDASSSMATIRVLATNGPLSYQWMLNGCPVQGATSSSFQVSNIGLANIGVYSVVVSNPIGSVISSNASLSYTAFFETFEQDSVAANGLGAFANWTNTVAPPGSTLMKLNQDPGYNFSRPGTKSCRTDCNNMFMYHTLGSPAGCFDLSFWIFDDLSANTNDSILLTFSDSSRSNCIFIGLTNVPGAWDGFSSNGYYVIGIKTGATVKTQRLFPRGPYWNYFEISCDPSGEISAGGYCWYLTEGVGGPANLWPIGMTPGSLNTIILESFGATNNVFGPGSNAGAWFDDIRLEYSSSTVITNGPSDQFVQAGSTATFSLGAMGTGLQYQWYKDGQLMPGATGSSLSIPNAQGADAGNYSAIVTTTSGGPAVSSGSANLAVLTSPGNFTTAGGSTITLGAGVAGDTAQSYQWNRNGKPLSDGSHLSGTKSANLTINNATNTDAGTYTVTATTSRYLTLTSPGASISYSPTLSGLTNQFARSGANVTFALSGGDSNLSYQWLGNGTPVPGATNSSYTLYDIQLADAGNYTIMVTNNNVLTLSASANLAVLNGPAANVQLPVGSALNLTASVLSNTAPVAFQWKKKGINVVNGGRVSGATSSSLTITGAVTNDNAAYSVVAKCGTVSVTSLGASVSVNAAAMMPVPPVRIVRQPADQTVYQGSPASFSVTAVGGKALTYQWQTNGSAVPSGTGSSLALSNLMPSNSGNYSVIIYSNGIPVITSASAELDIRPAYKPDHIFYLTADPTHTNLAPNELAATTPDHPYCITDPTNYTRLLTNYNNNCEFHYEPGVYETFGYQAHSRKTAGTNCKHYGSGTNTIVRLVGAYQHYCDDGIIFGSTDVCTDTSDGFELHDLQLDCNAANQPKYTNGQPKWLYVDLGTNESISKIVLKWGSHFSQDYRIQVFSSYSDAWTNPPYSFTLTNGEGGTDTFLTNGLSGRYVGFYAPRFVGTNDGYWLSELEVYGDGPENLARAKSVSSSLTQTNLAYGRSVLTSGDLISGSNENVVDGDTNTCWHPISHGAVSALWVSGSYIVLKNLLVVGFGTKTDKEAFPFCYWTADSVEYKDFTNV